ncbi:TetR/AcrR family transcriptional regulator [Nocardia beijingensis]|uniref:TetR/AcrR family transcriptional regulator n=1 Tax=Nocardia beijingensis TaxID=95162 RepID=UPI0018959DB1|nr:TetR/AcrR family transcriptional regulator [Nocardia beijingensis]MBF6468300.1 TetR/AcrR family transcriptional regulator [Nocardia beijingensis]
MTTQDMAVHRGLRSDKRASILRGARAVFCRDGYARASVDAIARESAVSTRTIYKHFADKKQLFTAVIVDSAAHTRASRCAAIDHHLDEVVDLEADLIALGLAFVVGGDEHHFALVRQIRAEADHIPGAVLDAWLDSGPRAVHAALARKFAELAARGVLHLDDAQRAAVHFVLLAAGEANDRTFWGAVTAEPGAIEADVTAGVRAFLRAYGAASTH